MNNYPQQLSFKADLKSDTVIPYPVYAYKYVRYKGPLFPKAQR